MIFSSYLFIHVISIAQAWSIRQQPLNTFLAAHLLLLISIDDKEWERFAFYVKLDLINRVIAEALNTFSLFLKTFLISLFFLFHIHFYQKIQTR